MRSAWLVGLIVGYAGYAGCGFSGPGAPGDDPGDEPGGGGSGSGSDTGSTSAACDAHDASLRLCLTFNQNPMVQDVLEPPHELVENAGVIPIGILGDTVAKLTAASRIRFKEVPDFDVPDLTIDMWIAPAAIAPDKHYWILDNNTQYFVVYDGDGSVRCGIGTDVSVNSQVKISGTAGHHVACTYATADHTLRVHVDGEVSGCTAAPNGIPQSGADGVAIGANYGGGNFKENFIGNLDRVHLYARALTPDEICRASGRSHCNTQCQNQEGGHGGH